MAKHRTAAQKRATAKLVAFNRSRRKTHHKKPRHVSHMKANPIYRKRKYKRNPVSHHHKRRYKRNPSARMSGIMALFNPALQGAVGALGIDLITGFLPLPLGIKVSPARHAIKGVLAIGLGMLVRGNFGRNMAVGGLTVALHDAGREVIGAVAPSMNLGMDATVKDLAGIGYYNPASTPELGLYQPEGVAGMGEMPANADSGYYTY